MARRENLILLTGVAGYFGRRLLRALEKAGRPVRCLVTPSESSPESVSATTEFTPGDLLDPAFIRVAMQGVDTAYYFPHKRALRAPFEEDPRRAATEFAAAARQAGVKRIIYLGGLSGGGRYSGHVWKPQEIAGILRDSGAQVIEFRAPVILGPGSLAFEMVRAVVESLPVMVAPRWTRTPTYPIAIEDVIAYMMAALDVEVRESAVFEIGGPDKASFSDLLKEYARQRGLKIWLLPMPVRMPRLSILGLSLCTPMYGRIAQELVATLCNKSRLDHTRALEAFPIRPRGIREAIEHAWRSEGDGADGTPASAGHRLRPARRKQSGVRFGPRIIDSRSAQVPYPPAAAFQPIERIGGKTGWYYANWLWKLRGLLDVMVGGVGTSRGRRDPQKLAVGDVVDFWRVEAIEGEHLLRLAAEMKLPGRAWLQFELERNGNGSTIRQTAIFDPIGLSGLLYWYVLSPAHEMIFPGMLRGIERAIQP